MRIRLLVFTGLLAATSLLAAPAHHHGSAASVLVGIVQSLLGLAVLTLPLRAGDPHLSAEERTQVLSVLDESHQEFFAALNGVSEAQWNWKPAPERWSVGETAQHIVLAEGLLFAFVRKAIATPPNPVWEEQTSGKAEFLFRVMPSRQGKAVAPDPIVPRQSLTRVQVTERFEEQRFDIVNFAREAGIPLKQHTVAHPFPVFGTLNAHQWLLYVPLHTLRHHKQIMEVKAAPGYPAN